MWSYFAYIHIISEGPSVSKYMKSIQGCIHSPWGLWLWRELSYVPQEGGDDSPYALLGGCLIHPWGGRQGT